jgi:hypothetical protein
MVFPFKILGLVRSCGLCPNYEYYSGGVHRCKLVEEVVIDNTVVASFCPLSNYPSDIMAQMEMTISTLREPHKHGFGVVLLGHIATKLKLNLDTNQLGLIILLNDAGKGREVYLSLDHICEILVHPFEITFTSGLSVFKLSPDTRPVVLREATDEDHILWRYHELCI